MDFTHIGIVDRYPGPKGWHFVALPEELVEPLRHRADRGLIAVTATVGATSWQTSLLPKGDGTLFWLCQPRCEKPKTLRSEKRSPWVSLPARD